MEGGQIKKLAASGVVASNTCILNDTPGHCTGLGANPIIVP